MNRKVNNKIKKQKKIAQRTFIETTSINTTGLLIVPSHAISGLGRKVPSDKLNIAGIGIGGIGKVNLQRMVTENIVALC